ncbi:MAG TPA: AI-2E family transporter [Pseudobacteroides sp.]|nr:AI-2E family transporter [Pseudobacteroides sp.]
MHSKRKILIFIVLIILLILICLFIIKNIDNIIDIIIPFFIAIIIAYTLKPIVLKLETKKIPRSLSIILIYIVLTSVIIVTTIFIVPELIANAKDIMDKLPEFTGKYQKIFNNYISNIRSSKWSPEIKNAILNEIQNVSNKLQDFIMSTLTKSLNTTMKAVTIFFDLTLSLIIAYYFIKDSKSFRDGFLSLVPRKWRNGLINTGREINEILSNFIQGQLLTALIVGILEALGLLIINSKYPLILGLIGGIANIIPYFGPFLGCLPAVALALVESPLKALWTIVIFSLVQQIDNAFISPKIIEGKLGLHPLTTIIVVLIGGKFFGIIGMLVSVPIFAIIKVILKRSVEAIV